MQHFDVVRHREDLWSVMSNGQGVYYFTTPEEAEAAALVLEKLSGVCCRYLGEDEAHRRAPEPCGPFGSGVGETPLAAWSRPRSCTCLALSWWGLNKGLHPSAQTMPV